MIINKTSAVLCDDYDYHAYHDHDDYDNNDHDYNLIVDKTRAALCEHVRVVSLLRLRIILAFLQRDIDVLIFLRSKTLPPMSCLSLMCFECFRFKNQEYGKLH